VAGFEKNLQRLNEAAGRLITLQLANSGADERLSVGALVRNLLLTRLSRDSRAGQIRRRFVAYFLAYAQSYSEPTAENFDALELEFENLLDALDISSKLQNPNQFIQIYQVLSGFLDVRGYWDEALRRNSQAQKAARKLKRIELLPDLDQIAADIFLRRREFPKAQAGYQAALAGYRSTDNQRGSATALRKLGSIALEQANPDEAEKLYNESLAISREINDQAGVADNLHNLAIVAQERRDLGRAEELYREGLEISEKLGDPGSVAVSYHQLGVIAEENGNFEEAQKLFERSLEIKTKLGDQNGMAATLHLLGRLKARIGQTREAEPLLGRALDIFDNLASPTAAEVGRDIAALSAPHLAPSALRDNLQPAASLSAPALSPPGDSILAEGPALTPATPIGNFADSEVEPDFDPGDAVGVSGSRPSSSRSYK